MAEEANKTEVKIEIIDSEAVKKDGSEGARASEGAAEEDNLSPDQKIIAELKERAQKAEEGEKKALNERDEERQKKTHAQSEAKTALERQIQAKEESIKSRVESTRTAFEKAQQDYEDAYDSGDRKRLVAAQVALNDAQAQLRGAEFNEEQFSTWKESAKNSVPASGNSRFTKPEQEWIAKNPSFNTDRRFRAATYAADEEAKEKGIVVDSPEYFKHLDDYLSDVGFEVHGRSLKKENDEDDEPKTPPKKEPKKTEKQQSSTAAPVGNSTGSTGGGKSKTFVMTPEMREAASWTFPDLHKKDPKAAEEKYAKIQLDIQEKKARGEL